MKLSKFSELAELHDCTEMEKARRLTFFFTILGEVMEVPLSYITNAMDELHFSKPNSSRLMAAISRSSSFVRAKEGGNVKLHANSLRELRQLFPSLSPQSEEISLSGCLLTRALYENAPTYIVKLGDQINASFENNIMDGCAVLMRRLLEVLLIQSYEKLKIETEIQDTEGNYKLLDGISKNAKTNGILKLSRNTKKNLDDFKSLGNFAAHKIMYTTRRGDIENVSKDYRGAIEELLYKAGYLT